MHKLIEDEMRKRDSSQTYEEMRVHEYAIRLLENATKCDEPLDYLARRRERAWETADAYKDRDKMIAASATYLMLVCDLARSRVELADVWKRD